MHSFWQAPYQTNPAMKEWLERMLGVLTKIIVLLSIFPVWSNFSLFIERGWHITAAVTFVCFAAFVVISFFKTPYLVRVHTLLWSIYILSIISLYHIGLSGDGRPLVIATTIIATLFISMRFGFFMAVLNLFTFSALGHGMTNRLIPVPSVEIIANSGNTISWVNTGLVISAILLLVAFLVGQLVEFLSKNLLALQDSNQQLNALNQMMLTIQENERKKLAHDLHDMILNNLAVISMDLQVEADNKKTAQKIHELANQVRGTINNIRPPILNFGLYNGLEQLVDTLQDRIDQQDELTQLTFEVTSEETKIVPQAEQHIYRIIQQACENAVRHAQASKITISGSIKNEEISLQVQDDGIGFELNQDLNLLTVDDHYGLVYMNERAKLIGADLEIRTDPTEGTLIQLNWQMPKTQQLTPSQESQH